MSTVGETTFSKLDTLYCKCEWQEEEMLLTVVHCETAWTARLAKTGLDLGSQAGGEEEVSQKELKMTP